MHTKRTLGLCCGLVPANVGVKSTIAELRVRCGCCVSSEKKEECPSCRAPNLRLLVLLRAVAWLTRAGRGSVLIRPEARGTPQLLGVNKLVGLRAVGVRAVGGARRPVAVGVEVDNQPCRPLYLEDDVPNAAV